MFYDTADDTCDAAKDIASDWGFQLTRDSHKKNPREEEKRLHLYCSHGGRGNSQFTASLEIHIVLGLYVLSVCAA